MRKTIIIFVLIFSAFFTYAEIKIKGGTNMKIAVATGNDAGEDLEVRVVAYNGYLSVEFGAYKEKKGSYKFRLYVNDEKFLYKTFPTYSEYKNVMAEKGFPNGLALEFASCYDEIKSELEKYVVVE